jgi:hypothetical protein
MAASLEELSAKFDDIAKQMNSFSGMAKQFEGIREMMKQTLDSVNNMGSRETSTEVMISDLCTSADAATASFRNTSSRIDSLVMRIDSLEAPTNPGITPGPSVLGVRHQQRPRHLSRGCPICTLLRGRHHAHL